MSLQARMAQVYQEIAQACARVGRDPSEVRLIGVSKTVGPDRIQEAVDLGLKDLGENRVAELSEKVSQVSGADWHFIGHLQTRKVRQVVEQVRWIHSLDRLSLAQELSRRIQGPAVNCLVQVNVSGEESKYGLSPDQLPQFLRQIRDLPGIRVRGLMTMAPLTEDEGLIRQTFAGLRQLAQENQGIEGIELLELSMGMSNDFQVAIEEGATMVRLGTRIFHQG